MYFTEEQLVLMLTVYEHLLEPILWLALLVVKDLSIFGCFERSLEALVVVIKKKMMAVRRRMMEGYADAVDEMEQEELKFFPVGPLMNLGLQKLPVFIDQVGDGEIFSGHHKVSLSELQARAKIADPIAQVNHPFLLPFPFQ